MKLFYNKSSRDPIYYAQQGTRNGTETTTRNVRRSSEHSELLKITDDPLAYVKEELRKMNEEYRVGKADFAISTDFNERVKHSSDTAFSSNWLNIGYFFLQIFLGKFRLQDFFREKVDGRWITLDYYTIHRFPIYVRILDPLSKYIIWHKPDPYCEKPGFDYQHILRLMNLLKENYDDYLVWLYRQNNTIAEGDTSVLYYDHTNFHFECEQENEDIVDEVTGKAMKGLRQYDGCKEHRPNPIVEMGLFMDNQGTPITMCLHSGSTSEQLIAIPLEKEVLNMLLNAKFICHTDTGLGSYNIREFNSTGGRVSIVMQPVKKLSGTLKGAVSNDYDYRLLSDNSPVTIRDMKTFGRHKKNSLGLYNDHTHKVVAADKVLDLGLYKGIALKNGRTVQRKAKGTLKQRIIITFPGKMAEYQRTIRNRQIERAKKLFPMKGPEEIKEGSNDVKRLMKRISKTKSEEKAETEYILGGSKIAEEEKYDDYRVVATNLSDPAKGILDVSRKRYQIKGCFRIMKTSLDGRSVNHRLPERVKTYLLICFTALLVYCLMEVRLDKQKTHVTINDLITTLKNMNVANVHDIEYIALHNGSKALNALTRLTLPPLDRMHYRPRELSGIIKEILEQCLYTTLLLCRKNWSFLFHEGFRLFTLAQLSKMGLQGNVAVRSSVF